MNPPCKFHRGDFLSAILLFGHRVISLPQKPRPVMPSSKPGPFLIVIYKHEFYSEPQNHNAFDSAVIILFSCV